MSNLSSNSPYQAGTLPQAGQRKQEIRTLKLDLYEEEKQYFLRVSLPGVKKENLNLSFHGDELEIKGIVTSNAPEHTRKILAEEIFQGRFLRRILLPNDADKDNLKFDYNRGILEIVIPKRDQ